MAIISLLALVSNNSFAFASRYSISSTVSFKTKSAPFSEVILNAHGGAAAIEAKGTPDFNMTATTNMGMYAATDDYGTSYYFRGAVNDNWVYFAGFYWRIIRINGDGSVRMIYTGSGNEWFTMSPVTFSSNKAYVYRVNGYGGLVTGDVIVSGSYGMRPVISLKGDVLVRGNGTWNNPYTIY